MAGAILVAVPLILMATGAKDDDKKLNASSSSSAGTVVEDDEQKSGRFVDESLAPKKSSSPSPEKTAEERKAGGTKTEPEVSKAPEPTQPTTEPEQKPEEKPETKKEAAAPATGGMPPITTRVLIKNWTNRTCVDVPGGGALDGPLHQSACTNSPNDNQLWNLEKKQSQAGPGGADLFVIRNVVTKRCLDLPGRGGAASSTPLKETHCNGTTGDNQL
ncbi:RICIN domain-containing protein [Streptomyces sp. NPDC093109]|uniref:RICIN domain-containing protein n=1 Tax=Streptomyces sp. NPDC093109 TaxID=3154977 RepID=UPI00344D9BFE